ncbi:hypothetical protein B9G98_03917 [Wickerhamiella sorbophila]|uniref:Methyltransferase domain-containing protein n=1 Tax=Wickerhamiella sorbophila TaxID=45607 RepID=A0A2T0FMV0_9ASCO|nr:hypothetical protein B9G98_03917 [Wickerhamiella sorbophila]PRT56297.1 hypothetical protein B9G98_03917 [Wickerhamiella sorbophila]
MMLSIAAVCLSAAVFIAAALLFSPASTLLIFCWNCFLKPIGKTGNQQTSLERFYKSQASIYDSTRKTLLKGRELMLRLAKSHLRFTSDMVWVDLGGGTGYNIEKMNEYIPLSQFKAIYLVDLSPSLCEVARKRFEAIGATNVFVHCRDVNEFELPDNQKAHLVTMSYSLSMIPNYHSTVDRAAALLHDDGLAGVVDFYVQSESSYTAKTNTLGGELHRHVNWLSRNFWRLWFEFDHVHLDPARRDYLEYRMGTIKSLNCRNKILGHIPYYVWVGCDKRNASDINYRHQLATESPFLAPRLPAASGSCENLLDLPVKSKGHDAAHVAMLQNMPYPSFYYQREIWRIYYDSQAAHHHQFNNQYIYAFTWEDPIEDHNILKFNSDDVVLAITSAGDNLLAYAALDKPPRRIHGVDMNPHQNHLVELKLAALRALSYDDIWMMFGEGKHPKFHELLVNKLAVHMSSPAFQYWFQVGEDTFSGAGLYDTGSTRWALRLVRWIFKICNIKAQVDALCDAKSIEEQKQIWNKQIRPVLLSPITRLAVCNSVFLWKALGVPMNQADCIETSLFQYIVDTLDPLIDTYRIGTENYFYYLCLNGRYSPKTCPSYITKRGYFNLSRRRSGLDGIRLHTDSINDVVERLTPGTVTIAIVMDHMDWFSPAGKEVDEEISQLHKALANGGRVMLRSSSTKPWYLKNFQIHGFAIEPAAVRKPGMAIDRVNMYASTWVCTKPGMQDLVI